jgi:hypothetical protein
MHWLHLYASFGFIALSLIPPTTSFPLELVPRASNPTQDACGPRFQFLKDQPNNSGLQSPSKVNLRTAGFNSCFARAATGTSSAAASVPQLAQGQALSFPYQDNGQTSVTAGTVSLLWSPAARASEEANANAAGYT